MFLSRAFVMTSQNGGYAALKILCVFLFFRTKTALYCGIHCLNGEAR